MLVRLGVPSYFREIATLSLVGRRTGKPRPVSVAMIALDDRRYVGAEWHDGVDRQSGGYGYGAYGLGSWALAAAAFVALALALRFSVIVLVPGNGSRNQP